MSPAEAAISTALKALKLARHAGAGSETLGIRLAYLREQASEEALTALLSELDALRARCEKAEARVALLDAPWVDEKGTAWAAPTAWAYAQACRVKDELHARCAAGETLLRESRRRLSIVTGYVSRSARDTHNRHVKDIDAHLGAAHER